MSRFLAFKGACTYSSVEDGKRLIALPISGEDPFPTRPRHKQGHHTLNKAQIIAKPCGFQALYPWKGNQPHKPQKEEDQNWVFHCIAKL